MKNLKKYLIILIAVSFLSACSETMPLMVTNNPVGTKRGIAERTVFMGFTFGHTDLGIATAAKNGKITKVATVDFKFKGGMFTKTYTTIVTGE